MYNNDNNTYGYQSNSTQQPIQQNNYNYTNNNGIKNSNKPIIIIVVAILVAVVTFIIIKNNDNKSDNKNSNSNIESNSNVISNINSNSNEVSNSNNNTTFKYTCINGIYSSGDSQLYVVCLNDNKEQKLYYLLGDSKGYVKSKYIIGATFESEIATFGSDTFQFKDNQLIAKMDNVTKIYKKINNYEVSNMIKTVFSAYAEIFDGKYNNVYSKDKGYIMTYPLGNDKIAFRYGRYKNSLVMSNFTAFTFKFNNISGLDTLTCTLEKKNGATYECVDKTDNKTTVTVEYTDNGINVNYSTSNSNMKIDNINGSYTKVNIVNPEDLLTSNHIFK